MFAIADKAAELLNCMGSFSQKVSRVCEGYEHILELRESSTYMQSKVGGEKDCWLKIFSTNIKADEMVTLEALLDAIEVLLVKQVPTERPPQYSDDGLCYCCFEDKETCIEVGECEVPEEDPYSEMKQFYLLFSHTYAGDLHLEHYRYSSAGAHDVSEYISAYDLKYVPNFYFSNLPPKYLKVGSAVSMVENAKKLMTAEIAKTQATLSFNDDLASVPKVPFRLTKTEKAAIERRLGYEIHSTNQSANFNGHKAIQVERHLARTSLDNRYPHNTDRDTALHIASTLVDVSRWWSHSGHDFYFHLSEDKDILRVAQMLVTLIGKKVANMTLPTLTSVKGNATRLSNLTLKDCLEILSEGGRQRFFFDKSAIKKQYNTLFFPDCLYDIPESEFLDYWRITGALKAHAILFVPDALVTDCCPDSDVYNYEEVYPSQDIVEKVVNTVWPEITLITAFLPLEGLREYIISLFTDLLKKGADFLKRVLLAPTGSSNLLFQFLGVSLEALKLDAVFDKMITTIGRQLWDMIANVRITWKSGTGNGYFHRKKLWKAYAEQRRFRAEDICVDTELAEAHGEMWIIDMYRSTGQSDICYSFNLPPHKRTVKVLDVFSSYDKGAGTFSSKSYVKVHFEDWHKIVNWCLAEPANSIDFAVVMTTVNRIRGGLSLGENVMVAPMHMYSDDVKKIAMAAMIYTFQLNGLIAEIEHDKDMIASYRSNLANIAISVAKYGLIIATGGLAIPIWQILKWLLTEHPNLELIAPDTKIETRLIRGKPSTYESPLRNLSNISLQFPHKPAKARNSCWICDLQETGHFSKDGIPEHGQEFICENRDKPTARKIEFSPGEMVTLTGRVRAAKEAHRAMNAMKLVEKIDKMQDWCDKISASPQSHDYNLNYIRGGPGTGKSTVVKVLMKKFEERGFKTVLGSPFSKLLDEFSQTEVLGYKGLHDFEAETFWYLTKHSNVDVLIVDEVSNIDWDLLQLMVLYIGARDVYIVGDEQQTHLNHTAGEGIDPLNFEVQNPPLDLTTVPTHTLIWNFRNPPHIVKLLNMRFGYKMKSKREDWDLLPEVLSVEEYNSTVKKVDRELVFAHASAQAVFGKESIQGDKERNMSVRSAQGMTYNSVSVSFSEMDVNVAEVLGMKVVAFSRHKTHLKIVHISDDQDQKIIELKEFLMVDSPASIELLRRQPWPVFEKETISRELTPEEIRLESILRRHARAERISIEKNIWSDSTETLVESGVPLVLEAHQSPLEINPLIPILDERPLYDTFKNIFSTCVIDLLETKFPMDQINQMMEMWYYDDQLMGRPKQKWYSPKVYFTERLNIDKDGKHVPNMQLYLHAANMFNWRISFWKSEFVLIASSDSWKKASESGNELNILVADHHAVERIPRVVIVNSPDLPIDFRVNDLDFSQNGKRYMYDSSTPRNKREKRNYTFEPVPPSYTIGYKTIIDVELSREAKELATKHAPIIGSRMMEREKPWMYENQPFKKTKTRAGKDAYRMMDLFDPSGAEIRYPIVNWPYAVLGNVEDKECDVTPEGFIFQRTKAGKLKRIIERKVHSFKPGMVHHFSDASEETMIALSRIGKSKPKPKLNHEIKMWCEKVANDYYNENFSDVVIPQELKNAIVHSALQAVKQRNYDGRRIAERKKDPLEKLRILVSNKSIAKFKWPMNVLKGGQALSMTPPRINEEFIAFFRILNTKMKYAANPDVFFDDYEHQDDFVMRINKALFELPESVQFAVVDAKEFDSQQSEVTCYMEKVFLERLGADPMSLDEYYKIRSEGIPWMLIGRAYGRMNGEKGSGFPDTKLGNTVCEGIVADQQFKGIGPKVKAGKGDDWLLVQSSLVEDQQGRAKVKAYTGLQLDCNISDSGSFIGYSVFKDGFVPDVVKSAYKALAAPARDYKHFTEQQKSYREKIETINRLGGISSAQRGAIASGYTENMGAAAYEILNSLGHISKDQWEKRVRKWKRPRFFLRAHDGPQKIRIGNFEAGSCLREKIAERTVSAFIWVCFFFYTFGCFFLQTVWHIDFERTFVFFVSPRNRNRNSVASLVSAISQLSVRSRGQGRRGRGRGRRGRRGRSRSRSRSRSRGRSRSRSVSRRSTSRGRNSLFYRSTTPVPVANPVTWMATSLSPDPVGFFPVRSPVQTMKGVISSITKAIDVTDCSSDDSKIGKITSAHLQVTAAGLELDVRLPVFGRLYFLMTDEGFTSDSDQNFLKKLKETIQTKDIDLKGEVKKHKISIPLGNVFSSVDYSDDDLGSGYKPRLAIGIEIWSADEKYKTIDVIAYNASFLVKVK